MAAEFAVAAFALAAAVLAGEGPAAWEAGEVQPCPAECDCSYERVSWQTDCSARGLQAGPPLGLSPNGSLLDLSRNRIERLGPFPEHSRLRRLLLSDNQLRRLDAECFRGLELLLEADLSDNQIAHVEPDTFRNCAGLLTLQLANNQLSSLPGPLLTSGSLKNLDLSGNQLSGLPDNAFANASALASLDLSGNPLGTLPAAALAPLSGLEELRAARCELTALPAAAFVALQHLKLLDLSGNPLGPAARWSPALAPLTRLDSLTLSDCSLLPPLPPDLLARAPVLRRLALSANPALGHAGLWPALTAAQQPELAELEAADCGLRGPPPPGSLSPLARLRLLDLTDNELGPALPAGALAGPSELLVLRLARCGLAAPPGLAVFQAEAKPAAAPGKEAADAQSGPPLQELSLAGNPLLRLAAPDTPLLGGRAQASLRLLDLSNCSLRALPAAALRGARNLSELALADNPGLQQVPEDALRELPALSSLDLRRCNLSSASPAQLESNPRLRQLRLAGNPWRCGCGLRGLWAWAQRGNGEQFALADSGPGGGLACWPAGDDGSKPVPWEEYVKATDAAGECPEAASPILVRARRHADGVEVTTAGAGTALPAWLLPASAVWLGVVFGSLRGRREQGPAAAVWASG